MQLIHINKTYTNRNNTVDALRDITLDLDQNGFTMILGPSGCGKTTLMNIIAGRESYGGTIRHVPHFDYLTQEFNLFEDMSVMDNLVLVKDDSKVILEYLDQFRLTNEKDKKVKKLSNGEKKRVQFIRALLHQPGLLLCDEPTAALDHENTVILMEELKKISDDIQIIMVTHDTALAEQYGDRIITLDQGTVVKDEIINRTGEAKQGKLIEKKNIVETLKVSCKELISRMSDSLVTVFLMFLCIITSFTMCNLQANVNRQSDYQSVFKNGENMIVSIPDEMTNNKGETLSGYTMKYTNLTVDDLFDYKEIKELIDETPEIIGVESWNSYQYQDGESNYELEYVREADDMKAYHIFTFTPDGGMKMELPDFPNDQPYMVSNDSVIFQNSEEYLLSLAENGKGVFSDYTVSAFDLVNGYSDLPLICGSLPDEDEVLLDKNAADLYKELNGVDNYEDIIGKILSLDVQSNRNNYCNENEDIAFADRITMKISGITSVENDFAVMVFFNNGYGNNPVYKHYVTDVHSMKTHFARFLLEPGCDYEAVAEKINTYFSKDDVKISRFKGEGLGKTKEFYASPAGFIIYGAVVLGILIVMSAVVMIIRRNRLKKEMNILKIYGYSGIAESLFRHLILITVAFIIVIISAAPIVDRINTIAKENYFQPFMTMNVGLLCGCTVVTVAVLYIMELLVKGKGTDAHH